MDLICIWISPIENMININICLQCSCSITITLEITLKAVVFLLLAFWYWNCFLRITARITANYNNWVRLITLHGLWIIHILPCLYARDLWSGWVLWIRICLLISYRQFLPYNPTNCWTWAAVEFNKILRYVL